MNRESQQDGKTRNDHTQDAASTTRLVSGEHDRAATRQSPGTLRGTSPLAWPQSPASLRKLEHTKRMVAGAQEQRTVLKLEELRRDAARNDVVTKDERRAGIGIDLPARVSPFVPNTATRRNITMRKSRDRLHDDVSVRTPDDVTKR